MRVPHRLRARSPRRVAAQVRLRAGRLGVARAALRVAEERSCLGLTQRLARLKPRRRLAVPVAVM